VIEYSRVGQLDTFIQELLALQSYVVLNYMAVVKIVKKWNKHVVAVQTKDPPLIDATSLLLTQVFYTSKTVADLLTNSETLRSRFTGMQQGVGQVGAQQQLPMGHLAFQGGVTASGRLLTPIGETDTLSPSAILQSMGVDLLREDTREGTDMRLDTRLGSALGSVGSALGSLGPNLGGTPRELGEHFKQENTSASEEQVRAQYSYVPELDFAGDREDTANLLNPDASPGLGATPSLATPGMLAAVSGITVSTEQASAQLAAMHSHSMKTQHMAGVIPSSKAMAMGGPAVPLHQMGQGSMLPYSVPMPSHSTKVSQGREHSQPPMQPPMHAPHRPGGSAPAPNRPTSTHHHVHGSSEQAEMGASSAVSMLPSAQVSAASEQGAMQASGHAMASDEPSAERERFGGRPLPRCLLYNHPPPPFEFQPKRKRGRPPKNPEATNIALKDQPIQLGPDGQPLSEREKNRLAARLFRKRQEDYIARLEAKADQLIQENQELENVKVDVTVSNSILRRRLKENQESNGAHATLTDEHAQQASVSVPISVPTL